MQYVNYKLETYSSKLGTPLNLTRGATNAYRVLKTGAPEPTPSLDLNREAINKNRQYLILNFDHNV